MDVEIDVPEMDKELGQEAETEDSDTGDEFEEKLTRLVQNSFAVDSDT